MRYGVGIDFGTTNSAAAVYDGSQVRLVQLGGKQRDIHTSILPDFIPDKQHTNH